MQKNIKVVQKKIIKIRPFTKNAEKIKITEKIRRFTKSGRYKRKKKQSVIKT